jgi:hypothetical protein
MKNICRVILLVLPLALFAVQGYAGEKSTQPGGIPKKTTQLDKSRENHYDAKGKLIGYTIRRNDGSVDVYKPDGTWRGRTQIDPRGGVLITGPDGKQSHLKNPTAK